MYLTSNFYIKSVTYVKTTPVAETIVKFCEIAHFSLKTTSFYEKLPLFTENYPPFIKNFGPPPYRKLKPLISAFKENSIFGNNRDPCLAKVPFGPHIAQKCVFKHFPCSSYILLVAFTGEDLACTCRGQENEGRRLLYVGHSKANKKPCACKLCKV